MRIAGANEGFIEQNENREMKVVDYNTDKSTVAGVIDDYLDIRKKMMKSEYQDCITDGDQVSNYLDG